MRTIFPPPRGPPWENIPADPQDPIAAQRAQEVREATEVPPQRAQEVREATEVPEATEVFVPVLVDSSAVQLPFLIADLIFIIRIKISSRKKKIWSNWLQRPAMISRTPSTAA